MNKELEQLNDEIQVLKREVKSLANEGKLAEAKAKKEELINLANKFDILWDLEEEKKENAKNGILKNGIPAEGGAVNKHGNFNIVNKGESFAKATTRGLKNDLSIGKYIKGMLTGDWTGSDNEKQVFNTLSTSTSKVVVPSVLSAEILDLARSKMALADVPIIPMTSNNLTIAKLEKDPTISFKEEGAVAQFSDASFGSVDLKTKTIYGLIKISLELLKSANIEDVIRESMAKALAQAIDKAGLYGLGNGIEPKGILTYDDINAIDSAPVETSKFSSFIKGYGAITRANGEPTTIAYNSNLDTSISMLTDTTGQPLQEPNKLMNLDHIVSNNIQDNQAIVFDKNSIFMGLQNRMVLDTKDSFEDGTVMIRVYAMLDFAVTNPKNITKITYKSDEK